MKLHSIAVSSFMALLAGCATTPTPPAGAPIYSYQPAQLTQSSSAYLSEAKKSHGNAQIDNQLLAVTKMLQTNNTNAASQELNKLTNISMNTIELNYYHLLKTYLALQLDQPQQALSQLQTINTINGFDGQQRSLYYTVAYETYTRTNHLADSVAMQIQLARLHNNQNFNELQAIFRNIQNLNTADLQQLVTHSNSLVQGWAQLGIIADEQANNSTNLVAAITQWKQQFPNHPANQLIPANFSAANQVPPPSQIAVLLPLTGQYAPLGHAVLNGFMTAYDMSTHRKPSLKIYDTGAGNVRDLYQQAVSNGAQLVVGPLDKEAVTALASSHLSVPTLALNYSDNPPQSLHLIEFGLSPTQAAQQTAAFAWQHGVSTMLTITPNNDWGKSVFQSFNVAWQQQGGNIVGQLAYTNGNLSDQIAKLLEIDQSMSRKIQFQHLVDTQLAFVPRRRYDANGIFLVASPEQAREIQPLLRFYFAGNLPIFATSLLYNGTTDVMRNRDLDNIYFNDMPLLLSNNAAIVTLRNTLQHTWPDSYSQLNRLYGVGIDAYRLSFAFQRLMTLPNFGINGVTGRLYLQQQQIDRQLMTAKFVNGIAQVVS